MLYFVSYDTIKIMVGTWVSSEGKWRPKEAIKPKSLNTFLNKYLFKSFTLHLALSNIFSKEFAF